MNRFFMDTKIPGELSHNDEKRTEHEKNGAEHLV